MAPLATFRSICLRLVKNLKEIENKKISLWGRGCGSVGSVLAWCVQRPVPSTHKSSVMVHTFKLCTGQVEALGSRVQGHWARAHNWDLNYGLKRYSVGKGLATHE